MATLRQRASQPKSQSLVESIVNVVVGFVINTTTQAIVFPWFGIHISLGQDVMIALVFTGISIARSFTLRRLFNWWHVRQI